MFDIRWKFLAAIDSAVSMEQTKDEMYIHLLKIMIGSYIQGVPGKVGQAVLCIIAGAVCD